MIDQLFARAYRAWRENLGALAVAGLIAWAIPIVIMLIVEGIAYIFGITDPENIPYWAMIIASVASIALLNGFSIAANYAVRSGKREIGEMMRTAWKRTLETSTALLFATFPAITGALLALVVIAFLDETGGWLASVLSLLGVFGSVLVSLMPYQAAEHGWQDAMSRSIDAGKKVYITLLLLNFFFALIYITLLSFFPSPEIGASALMIVDIFFLMHIRHQTFFEVLDSVSARE